MNSIAPIGSTIPAMSEESLKKVYELEDQILSYPQVQFEHTHTLHGGVYARTVFLPAGAIITGALIKVPTTLVVAGHVVAYFGDTTVEVNGHHVFMAESGRKSAFAAVGDTWLTMIFATGAATNEEAEMEFTDEYDRLMTRKER